MKRLALLTIFFYVCTFAAPQRAQAVAPVALIAAAAVGTAMMSASIGTYYAQNGVLPQYVSATAGAVASAASSSRFTQNPSKYEVSEQAFRKLLAPFKMKGPFELTNFTL